MTIIIGALLDDGRHIILGDGNIFMNGSRRASSFVKVRSIVGTYKGRKAILGVAGHPVDIQMYDDAIHAYLNTPSPAFTDVFYKLSQRYRDLQRTNESVGLAWIPDYDGKHALMSIDSNCFARQHIESNFHAEGSGGVEARATLLGLAYRAYVDQNISFQRFLVDWKPSMADVMISYQVACNMDAYCGGDMTMLSL